MGRGFGFNPWHGSQRFQAFGSKLQFLLELRLALSCTQRADCSSTSRAALFGEKLTTLPAFGID